MYDVHDVHDLDRSGAGPISSPIRTKIQDRVGYRCVSWVRVVQYGKLLEILTVQYYFLIFNVRVAKATAATAGPGSDDPRGDGP